MRGTGLLTMLMLAVQVAMPAAAQKGAFDDLPMGEAGERSVAVSHEDAMKKIRENIRVEAMSDKPSCYPGEQVLLTYRLYTAVQSNSTVASRPSLEGFISKELTKEYAEPEEKTIGGKTYRVFTVWQVRLTALQPGEYTIGSLSVNNEVRYTAADGSVRRYAAPVNSSIAHVRVLSLPTAGRPADFTGAVGQWRVSSRLGYDSLAVDDPDTLWVEIAGQGNFENLTPPVIRWPDGLRVDKPVERWEVEEDGTPQTGRKLVGYPFSGVRAGSYVLPAVVLSFFDAEANAYREARADGRAVRVTGEPTKTTTRVIPPDAQVMNAQRSRIVLLCTLIGLVAAGGIVVVLHRKRIRAMTDRNL